CQTNAVLPLKLTSSSPMDESVRLADKGLLDPPLRGHYNVGARFKSRRDCFYELVSSHLSRRRDPVTNSCDLPAVDRLAGIPLLCGRRDGSRSRKRVFYPAAFRMRGPARIRTRVCRES